MITVEFRFLVYSAWKPKEIPFRFLLFLDETGHHIEFPYCDLFSEPMC